MTEFTKEEEKARDWTAPLKATCREGPKKGLGETLGMDWHMWLWLPPHSLMFHDPWYHKLFTEPDSQVYAKMTFFNLLISLS